MHVLNHPAHDGIASDLLSAPGMCYGFQITYQLRWHCIRPTPSAWHALQGLQTKQHRRCTLAVVHTVKSPICGYQVPFRFP